MNVKSLIPWGNNRSLDASRFADPTSPFGALHREVNRMFDDLWRGFDAPEITTSAWPHIELCDEDHQLKVVAELPGLEERDVELTLDNGVLTLKGHKTIEKGGTVYSERWEGAFERDITVGRDVDADKVTASFKNGVLTILLPKKPEAQREVRRISIH